MIGCSTTSMPGASSSHRAGLLAHLPTARELSTLAATAIPRLLDIAFVDSRTSLLNAAALDEVARFYDDRRDTLLAAVFLDLTGFKAINDELGHTAGNAALSLVGATLARQSRVTGSIPFRYGGDEFVILAAPNKVRRIAGYEFKWRFAFEQKKRSFGASVGWAIPSKHESLRAVIDHADVACRVSKYERKDGHVRWSSNLRLRPRYSDRYRCASCRASIAIDVAVSEVNHNRASECHNCAVPRDGSPRATKRK